MRIYGRKIIGICLAVVIGLSLPACGQKQQSKQETSQGQSTASGKEVTDKEESDEVIGTITVLTDRVDMIKTKFAEYKMAFEEKYPGTEVVFKQFGKYEASASDKIKENDYGDVLLIPHSISNDELEEYFEPFGTLEELSKDYDEKYLQERQKDGIVYGLAQYATPQGIVYNKKVFEKAGILELPQNPEDFIKALKAIQVTQPEVIPYYTNEKMSEGLSAWQQHAWGSVSADPDYHYNGIVMENTPFDEQKPNFIVHKLLYDIVKADLCEKESDGINWNTAKTMLNQGEMGCTLVDWNLISEIQSASTNPDDIGYMPFPYSIDGVQYATTTIEYCYGINKNSENKATARAWIDYMLKDSGYAVSEGAISIKKKTDLPKLLENFNDVELVIDNLATAGNIGKYDEINEMSGILLDEDMGKKIILEEAGKEDGESFEAIMKDWNNKWKKALKGNAGEE